MDSTQHIIKMVAGTKSREELAAELEQRELELKQHLADIDEWCETACFIFDEDLEREIKLRKRIKKIRHTIGTLAA